MTVEFNEAFFVALGRDPAILGLCEQAAHKIAGLARANAPVDEGDYRDSIHVERGQRGGRGVYLVVADDPKALLIEAKHGTLARAARNA